MAQKFLSEKEGGKGELLQAQWIIVEPLYSGHHWVMKFVEGGHISRVDLY